MAARRDYDFTTKGEDIAYGMGKVAAYRDAEVILSAALRAIERRREASRQENEQREQVA